MSGDVSAVLGSAKWAEDSYYLKEFIHKFPLPQVAKVGIPFVFLQNIVFVYISSFKIFRYKLLKAVFMQINVQALQFEMVFHFLFDEEFD